MWIKPPCALPGPNADCELAPVWHSCPLISLLFVVVRLYKVQRTRTQPALLITQNAIYAGVGDAPEEMQVGPCELMGFNVGDFQVESGVCTTAGGPLTSLIVPTKS